MSTPNQATPLRLPIQPSLEHLKKQAKRRAKADALQLAEAQHRLAIDYGFASWPKLVGHVESILRTSDWHSDPADNLPKAANTGDLVKVRSILASGRYAQPELDLALGRIVCNMGSYSQADRWQIADALLAAGADPDGDYGGNYGPIVFGACEGIDYDGLKWLIDRGADVSFAPIDTKYGKASPLSHLLGTYGRGKNEAKHKAIDLLLAKGAVIPAEVTPEVFAIHRGDARLLGEMIDADRSLLGRRFRDMPYGNIALAGATLLHCAVEFGEVDCVDAILSRYRSWHDADLNSKSEVIDGIGGQTPLYHAINTNGDGCFYMLQYLIQRNGRYIDMSVKATWRSYGQPQTTPLTPLEYAEKARREIDPKWAHYRPRVEEELALLRELDQRTALHRACERNDVATVARMLDETPQYLTPELWPPSYKAKSVAMTRLLLDRGLDPNVSSAPRRAIDLACYHALADVVDLLIERGADVTSRNRLNETPLELLEAYEPRPIGDPDARRVRVALLKAGAKHDIHTAVRSGDVDEVRKLLDADPSLVHTPDPWDPLFTAARSGRLEVARLLIERGAAVDGSNDKGNTPLWFACQSPARADDRIAVARLLLEHGANPRRECEDKSTPLHFAAWRGPREMVELLLRHNAKEWQTDKDGKKPIDYARGHGVAADRDAIIELLDRPVIRDPNFKAAVRALHTGDLPALRQLLADHPNLATDRAVEPDCYQPGYFKDPKLLWFVAWNPGLVPTMPPNIVEITAAIIDAGVVREDLSYTLELVMTSDPARDQGFQQPLMRLLLARGAEVTPAAINSTLGHGLQAPVRMLVAEGLPMTAPIAAALGRLDDLPHLLSSIPPSQLHAAFSMAVINRQLEAARLCLEAGADVKARLAVHVHSTPLHQAAIHDNVPMLQLLVAHGADLSPRDTLWNSTPLGWAIHEKKPAAEAYLRGIGAQT